MIQNDKQLAIVQRQLGIVERIIESWRQELLPENPKNFAIYAEGAIDEAAKLRAEIDDYRACKKPTVPGTPATPTATDQ